MKRLKLPEIEIYKNSRRIYCFSQKIYLKDIINISLIGKLNILFLGERGEGKTKLMEEVNSLYFGEKGIYIRARPDMKIREIFERFNIKNFRMELREIKNAPFTMIDEINRAPPVIQNEFFHILDGYIEFENKKIVLGKGYHVVFATANYERNGIRDRYKGIFEMDSAIMDRFHIIINIDYFQPTPKDALEILEEERKNGVKKADLSKEFKKLNERIEDVPLTLDAVITLLYLRYGFDFCSRVKGNSNRRIMNLLPSICDGCHKLGEGCGYIHPPSIRFLKNLVKFTKAKNLYLCLNKKNIKEVDYIDILESFSFLLPYNGIFNSYFVEEKYKGDEYEAAVNLKLRIKKVIEERKEGIEESIVNALEGKEPNRVFFKEEFGFLRDIIKEIWEIAKKEGNLIKMMNKNKKKFEKIALKSGNPFLKSFAKND